MKKYFKHFISLIICLIGVFLFGCICKAEGTVSNIHYSLSDNDTLTISGTGIVSDQQELYKYKENTKHLIIEEGITDLQNVNLWGFTKMETVKLPNTITAIHDNLFMSCHSLKKVDMPGATRIETKAFSNCQSLKEVNIPKTIYIGAEAFNECKSLKKVKNAKAVEEIGEFAFANCGSLKWPSFGTRLKKIGEWAFYNCSSLKDVVIPDSVTEIRRLTFWYCFNLEKLVLPASLEVWKKNAIECCPKLKTIVNRSRLSFEIYDFDGYRIWKSNGKHVKSVPAKKTAAARGTKLKIIYKLDGGKKTGKLPEYYEYGTLLRIPKNVKRKGYVMAGWDCWDMKSKDKDGTYEAIDRRLHLGPVVRWPELHPIWFEYSAKNTKKGAVELKVGDPENLLDRDAACFQYLVRYSTNKTMRNAKSKYITGYPAKTVFQNLKKGKTYYFQVGPIYDIEGDTPDFWLNKHKIKIKK